MSLIIPYYPLSSLINIMRSTYEGLQKNIRSLKTPKIEAWTNQYPDKDYIVTLENPEFTCVCPKTGLPDFANIIVQYKPGRYCVELKSFKMYMLFYRNIGIFHEHAINKILDDFVRSCKPKWAYIKGEFNTRGGIKTTVSAEYNKNQGSRNDQKRRIKISKKA